MPKQDVDEVVGKKSSLDLHLLALAGVLAKLD